MNPFLPIVGAVVLAALVITVAVPGGVFVVPVLVVAALCWAAYRYVRGRRAAGPVSPPEPGSGGHAHEEPIS